MRPIPDGPAGPSPRYARALVAPGSVSRKADREVAAAAGPFSFQTDLASNGPRSYPTPLQAAEEAGRSRIYQGIHFGFSKEAGRAAGRAIGAEIAATRLLPGHGDELC